MPGPLRSRPPRDSAGPLPESWCTGPEAWAIERHRLFRNAWQIVARGSDLASPGNYIVTTIAGTGVFAIRQPDGSVLGFRNLCRHQGMPVLDAGPGHCERLRCRFHGWTYGLNGTLIETPPAVAPPMPTDPEFTALTRIAAADQHGLILLSLDTRSGAAPPDVPTGLVATTDAPTGSVTEANWKREMERILSMDALLIWPNMAVFTGETPAILVVQPRGFTRSEVLTLPVRQSTTLSSAYNSLADFRTRVTALLAGSART